MNNLFVIALLSLATTLFIACKKDSGANKVPKISLGEVTPDSLNTGDYRDTIVIRFSLEDGNADLGYDKNQLDNFDIYVRDTRVDTFTGYFFPEIDDFVKNPQKGVQGTGYFFVFGAFTFVRDDSLHTATGDTTQFELYIKDKAGNESNRITTGNIYIRPL
jgi:hypothetical protein